MNDKNIANGIEYVKMGDYFLPNLTAPEGKHHVGKYGMMESVKVFGGPISKDLLTKEK